MYSVKTIADGIFTIEETGFVRSYLIEGSERAVLFDACASGGEAFRDAVFSLTQKPIKLVISHSDGDHTGGQEYFGTPAMHPSEYARYFSKQNPDRQIEPLWEGQVLRLGGVDLEVILIPGHTPGSIALFHKTSGRLFVGDTVSDMHVYMFGDGRDLRAFVATLEKLEGMADSIKTIHSAHGSVSLGVEWIEKAKKAAQKLLRGELEPKDPPREMPCKLYSHDGVNFLYAPR